MYKSNFGTKDQITFSDESEYYELLGYLAKSDSSTKIVWERNDEQGAWAQEGRIEFFKNNKSELRAGLSHTAGNGNILSRVNCNEFVENIMTYNNFSLGTNQNLEDIRSTIPNQYLNDFNAGLEI